MNDFNKEVSTWKEGETLINFDIEAAGVIAFRHNNLIVLEALGTASNIMTTTAMYNSGWRLFKKPSSVGNVNNSESKKESREPSIHEVLSLIDKIIDDMRLCDNKKANKK